MDFISTIYGFINDCLPTKDLRLLNDAIISRFAWNIGTSEFIVSRMDKHYRKLAEKLMKEIDKYTDENGPEEDPEKAVEKWLVDS